MKTNSFATNAAFLETQKIVLVLFFFGICTKYFDLNEN